MARTGWIIAAVVVAVGLVWIGQGLGIVRSGGFMVGDGRWAVIGGVMVAAGLSVAAINLRRRRSR